jgi:uncharacterized repeat protein (TIGR01451 family)
MKRFFFRIGVPAIIVVLGLIAYAYGQRGSIERSTSADIPAERTSPLRGNSQRTTSPNSSENPLRDKTLVAGPSSDNSLVKKSIADSRIKKAAAESSDTESVATISADPFGAAPNRVGSQASQRLSSDGIPDASALDPPETNNKAEQQRYPQLVGPSQNGNPMAERYPAAGSAPNQSYAADKAAGRYNRGEKSADRYSNRSAGAASPTAKSQEPAPFKADPFSEPTALSQNNDRARERDAGSIAMNNPADAFQNSEGAGQPGPKNLEGAQSPQVTIQKFAPNEIQVGKPAIFRVTVRNTGAIPAGQVEIHDQIPRGTKLLGTTPRASQSGRADVIWKIGTLRPGEESSVEMELMPTAEGEIGSVATIHFGADASARTMSTKPQLALEISGRDKVLIGEQAMLSITVSNPGTGVATGVVLEERIPQGLQHPAGAELEYEVGDLRPGESKKLDLPLSAVTPGKALNVLTAKADGNLQAEERFELLVVAPKLDVTMDGPKRRYLEREAVYQVSLTNPGTASAQQVELVAYLPPGLKFVSANNSGHYDETQRAVVWRLEELPSNETGSVELVTMPVAAGQHSIKLRGTAERGLAVEKEQPVVVEGIASITFQPVDVTGPIEVGGETNYEVHVVNQGSKAASNVQLAVILPPELQPLGAEGPTRHAVDGNRIIFEGLAKLAPKADANYRIRVRGIRPGDLRTKFQLVTDEMKTPVTKEESTRVFADE